MSFIFITGSIIILVAACYLLVCASEWLDDSIDSWLNHK